MICKTPLYSTMLFSEIFIDEADFLAEYKSSGLYLSAHKMTDDGVNYLYYLLYSKYANNPIANFDVNMFKYKMWAIMSQHGPIWEKQLDIQGKLRALTDTDVIQGGKAIYNHSYNPGTAPSTSTLEELTAINDQNTTNYKKSKMEAYTQLWDLVSRDVTEEFLARFSVCFKKFVRPEHPLLYITGVEEDEE